MLFGLKTRALSSATGTSRGDRERSIQGRLYTTKIKGGGVGCACFHATAGAIEGNHGAQGRGTIRTWTENTLNIFLFATFVLSWLYLHYDCVLYKREKYLVLYFVELILHFASTIAMPTLMWLQARIIRQKGIIMPVFFRLLPSPTTSTLFRDSERFLTPHSFNLSLSCSFANAFFCHDAG